MNVMTEVGEDSYLNKESTLIRPGNYTILP